MKRRIPISIFPRPFRRAMVAIVIFASMSSMAQTRDTGSYSFTLQQTIDYAMQNQTRIQNAVYDEQSVEKRIKEITAMGLPQLSGSLDVKDFLEIPTSLVPADFAGGPPGTYFPVKFGTQYNATAGLDASMLVFSGEYIVALQSREVMREASRKGTRRTKIETAAAVSKAYYSVLVNDERAKLIDANVARLKKLMEDTKALNDNGFVEKLDLDRITVAYNNLLVEKEKVQRMLGLGIALLKFQAGMDQQASLSLTDKLADVKLMPEVAPAKFNYSDRVEYSLMETQKLGSEMQLKKEKYAFMPSFAIYGSYSRNAFRTEFDFFDFNKEWYPVGLIGARLNVPIFSGGQKRYRVQQAELSLLKSKNDLKFMQQSIDLDQANARISLVNAASSLDVQKKNMELAENIYRVSKVKYEQGVGSNLEVLNAETSLKEAQTNYFGALYDAMISKVDYDKATGTLIK